MGMAYGIVRLKNISIPRFQSELGLDWAPRIGRKPFEGSNDEREHNRAQHATIILEKCFVTSFFFPK
jgi:hypothetical protein